MSRKSGREGTIYRAKKWEEEVGLGESTWESPATQEPAALPCAALRGLPQKGTSKADSDPSPDALVILAASALAGRCLGSSEVCMLA